MLELNGVSFDHHGSRHDIYRHKDTGKMIPVPRHSEFSNEFLKDILKEIPGYKNR
jgi:predicted RNA binding protein YcfA (HicA-like mRNA interferase family)